MCDIIIINELYNGQKTNEKDNVNGNTKIYRYIKYKRLLDMLVNKELTLRRVDQWADVYENAVYKKIICSKKGLSEYDEKENDHIGIYGDCWTSFQRTYADAFWSNYSADPKGEECLSNTAVRVQTTVGKLLEILGSNTAYVGRVHYKSLSKSKSESEYIQELNKCINECDDINDAIIRSLLLKRDIYKHEKEVRLLYKTTTQGFGYEEKPTDKLRKFKIQNVEGLFDEFVLDPRLSKEQKKEMENGIAKLLPKANIVQSNLYKFIHNDINIPQKLKIQVDSL